MATQTIEQFILGIPKAELHCHIEGTLEPEMMFEIAKRNQIKLKYDSPEALRKAYHFTNLQSFLDIYYQGAGVLQTEQDFYDLTWAYLKRAQQNHVSHTEIFFDPQTHTQRGIAFSTVLNGIHRALKDGEKKLGISSHLILCFLRDLTEEQAFATLKEALPFKDKIIAIGLDSAEGGNPPEKFERVYQAAMEAGFLTVAHAGEEGSADYMWQAIKRLQVKRLDHGVRCVEDPDLVEYLKTNQIPLTVCPLSNVKLRVFDKMEDHNLKTLLDKGLCVMVNSDDPAYFGGYVVDNFLAAYKGLQLSSDDIVNLAKNSFKASFLSESQKAAHIQAIENYRKGFDL